MKLSPKVAAVVSAALGVVATLVADGIFDLPDLVTAVLLVAAAAGGGYAAKPEHQPEQSDEPDSSEK